MQHLYNGASGKSQGSQYPANAAQVPKTGYVDFTLVPSGTEIGQAGIIADPTLGLASVTIIKKPGSSGVYGIPPAGAYTGDPQLCEVHCKEGLLDAKPRWKCSGSIVEHELCVLLVDPFTSQTF